MNWKSEGKEYFNERSAGTQQTGFTLVAQVRLHADANMGHRSKMQARLSENQSTRARECILFNRSYM